MNIGNKDIQTAPASDGRIQSVDRALSILEAVASTGGEASLSDICDVTGLNTSTCHHIIKTLVARNYLRAGTGRGLYMMGSQVVLLSDAVNIKAELPGRAKPVLEALNQATQEAVHLAVLHNDEMITLAKRDALHALKIDSGGLGKSTAHHATATGKILLAGRSDDEARRIVGRYGMKKFTDHTCTDINVLLTELAEIRAAGCSFDREEFQLYVVCIGAPITDHKGEVIASISVSTPINRAQKEHLAFVQEEVISAAKSLSLTSMTGRDA